MKCSLTKQGVLQWPRLYKSSQSWIVLNLTTSKIPTSQAVNLNNSKYRLKDENKDIADKIQQWIA